MRTEEEYKLSEDKGNVAPQSRLPDSCPLRSPTPESNHHALPLKVEQSSLVRRVYSRGLPNDLIHVGNKKQTAAQLGKTARSCNIRLRAYGLSCSTCCGYVVDELQQLKGVEAVVVSVLTETVQVEYSRSETSPERIKALVEKCGYPCSIDRDDGFDTILLLVPAKHVAHIQQQLNTESGIERVTAQTIGSASSQEALLSIQYIPSAVGPRAVLSHVQKLADGKHISLFRNRDLDSAGFCATDSFVKSESQQKAEQEHFDLLVTGIVLTLPILFVHYLLPWTTSKRRLFGLDTVLGQFTFDDIVCFVCASIIQFYTARPIYLSAYASWKFSQKLNVDALITISTLIGYAFTAITMACSVAGYVSRTRFFDCAIVVVLIILSRYIDGQAKKYVVSGCQDLLKALPASANLLVGIRANSKQGTTSLWSHPMAGTHVLIDPELLEIGDVVKVFPGSVVPVDGTIVSGECYVDEEHLSRISQRVHKEKGDPIFAGSIVSGSEILIETTCTFYQSYIMRLCEAIEHAHLASPKADVLADRLERHFSIWILAMATIAFIWWYIHLARHKTVSDGLDVAGEALKFFLSTLIISCPCAIQYASQTAVMVASVVGYTNGIVFQSGQSLEDLASINTIVFQKAGILSRGDFRVVQERNLDGSRSQNWAMICALESLSSHPLAQTLMKHARDHNLTPGEDVDDLIANLSMYDSSIGCGVAANVGSRRIIVGSVSYLSSHGIILKEGHDLAAKKMSSDGCTVVCCAVDGTARLLIALKDDVKSEAVSVIKSLRNYFIECYLFTGDNVSVAQGLAIKVGLRICNVRAGLSPERRLSELSTLLQSGKRVAIVADPSRMPELGRLKNEHTLPIVSLTSCPSNSNIDVSDVACLNGNLSSVLASIAISRSTMRHIKIGLSWTLLYNMITVPLALGVLFPFLHISISPIVAGFCVTMATFPVILLALHIWLAVPTHAKHASLDKRPVKLEVDDVFSLDTPLLAV